MIEAIERHVAGTTVQAVLCGCSQCGHLWLVPVERGEPVRCSRCKSRQWNVVAEREFEPSGRSYQRRVRSCAAINPAPITPESAPIEQGNAIPAGVR